MPTDNPTSGGNNAPSDFPLSNPTGSPTREPTTVASDDSVIISNLFNYLNSLPLLIQLAIWIPFGIVCIIACALLRKFYYSRYKTKSNNKKLNYRRDISIITTSLDDVHHYKQKIDWFSNAEETTSTDETTDSWDTEVDGLSSVRRDRALPNFNLPSSWATSSDTVYSLKNPLEDIDESTVSSSNTTDLENQSQYLSNDSANSSYSDKGHINRVDAFESISNDATIYSIDVFNSNFQNNDDYV